MIPLHVLPSSGQINMEFLIKPTCVILLSKDLEGFQDFLFCDNLAFTVWLTSLISVASSLQSIIAWPHISSSSDVTIGRNLASCFLSTETESLNSTPSGLEIRVQRLKCIAVTFVDDRTWEIRWIVRHIYFISRVVVKESSASSIRSQWTNWHKAWATFFAEQQSRRLSHILRPNSGEVRGACRGQEIVLVTCLGVYLKFISCVPRIQPNG